MEEQRFSEDDRLLEPGSRLKLKLQNELLEFVIRYMEECLQGHTEGLDAKTVRQNPYALFIIEELSEKYAVWFEGLCSESGTDAERLPLTEGQFKERYQGNPQRILTEVIAHLNYESVDEYLRELQEWFKVKPDSGGTGETARQSILSVSIATRLACGTVGDPVGEEIPESA